MLLDPQELNELDWDTLRVVLSQPLNPCGARWIEEATPLERLTRWAYWGVRAQHEAVQDLYGLSDCPPPRFDPDGLGTPDWQVIEAVDSEERGPDGDRWPAERSTLGRLVAWARFGRAKTELV